MSLALPADFVLDRSGEGRIVAVRSDRIELLGTDLVRDPETVLRRSEARLAGRGRIASVAGPGGEELILKKYRRGGALGRWLPDAFMRTERMAADLFAGTRARSHGVPTAQVLGLILLRRWPLWVAFMLSEEVRGSRSLASVLGDGTEEARRAAEQAIRTVRRLHDAGVVHRDLNLHNLIVGEGEVYVIDLDGARIESAPSASRRFANLARLHRSYVKLFGERGPLSHERRRSLLGLYCGADAGMLREFESRLPAHKRALFLHGLLW